MANSTAMLEATGGSTITLANNIETAGAGGGIEFASSVMTPVVLTGTVILGPGASVIGNNDGTADDD